MSHYPTARRVLDIMSSAGASLLAEPVDDVPWSDAARDFGDVPIDDDTGQPSQPPTTLDHWHCEVILRARMSDGSVSRFIKADGTGMNPRHLPVSVANDMEIT